MSNFKPLCKRLPSLLVCFSCCALSCSSLFGQQRVIQQPAYRTYQPQQQYRGTPVYQQQQYPGRDIYGRIIQGQPVQNQPIQGQPVQGQNAAPRLQGTLLQAPNATQQPSQQAQPAGGNVAIVKQNEELKRRLTVGNEKLNSLTLDNGKLQQEIRQLDNAFNKVNMELTELRKRPMAGNDAIVKQNEELKQRLTAGNEKLNSLTSNNEILKKEVQQLDIAYDKVSIELAELRKNPVAASGTTMPDATALNATMRKQQKKFGQLSDRHRQAVQQNETLTNQIKTLTDESSNMKIELSNLKASGGADMTQLQTQLAETAAQVSELEQTKMTMGSDLDRLQRLHDSASTENANLVERVDVLSSSNAQYEAQLRTSLSNTKATVAKPAKMAEASSSQFTSSQSSTVSDLTEQNQELLALNEEAEAQNEFMNGRIRELEGTIETLSIDSTDLATVQTSPSIKSIDLPDSGEGKFSVMRWVLPFLGIGLTVGLYVFLTEENGAGLRELAGSRDDA